MKQRLSSDDTPDFNKEFHGPRSLDRLMRLLSILSQSSEGLSLSEISHLLDSPKSSILNLLRPLVAEGYLVHANSSYCLGPSMYRLAAGMLANWDFPKLIRPFMSELAERSGETVLLGVLNKEAESLTYVEIIEGPHPIRYHIPVGTTRTLYASASGRLLLAFSEPEWCENYVETVSFKVEMAKPITKASLKRDIKKIRKDGVSCTIDVYMKGLSAISAPVLNASGKCIASITAVGPSDRFVNELDSLREIVKDVAAKASGIIVDQQSL